MMMATLTPTYSWTIGASTYTWDSLQLDQHGFAGRCGDLYR